MMIETQKNIFNIMASINANRFIYYFKRLPLIGRILPDIVYEKVALKKVVAVIAGGSKVLSGFLAKALFLGLLVLLPVIFMEKDPVLRFNSYLHIFFMLNFTGSFLTSSIFSADLNRFIFLRLMRMDARSYIVSTVLCRALVDFLYFLPLVLISTKIMGGSLSQGFLPAIFLAAANLTGEVYFLLFYKRTGIMLNTKAPHVLTVAVLCLVSVYVPVFLHRPFAFIPLLFHPLFLFFLLGLIVFCLYSILSFRHYEQIGANTINPSKFAVTTEQMLRQARFSDVAVREKEFSALDLQSKKYESKTGFAYLNAIFFARHKRLLVKPILLRLAVIAVLFFTIIAVSFFIPHFIRPLSDLGKILPVFIFMMYFASIGERVCKAMFYNCDLSLLHYSFYRSRKAVLSNFRARLFRIAGLNFIVAAAISAAVVSLALIIFKLPWSFWDMLSFVLSIFFLALFFSVHHLFLYYVFQPYTTELGMKNPFYRVINYGVYLLCFFCTKIQSPPSSFTLIVLASTLIYIVGALILVYKYAPRTFRVK
ncbi:hypothetical protein Sgly_1449 [Syntrophobotulus glycolicus DSM 8271]|uniref:Uncharacterized protein n=1 Tax=Syntrophobotulus glycolicus (strain DSM 8271 / FlGlyR) TaxID=645991 RepID=F0SWI5_SYNGF|nr:hypothetical protein [Syntrophobotulus glycolicus]ADY55751.1 hypothetical protein Sgly_1449 [Syntrophobotulus glycolicus DSM 8271]